MSSVDSHSDLLNALGDIKARVQGQPGLVILPIPQFIVVAKDSVEKSRLLEAFAGEPFQFASGELGSRRPTVLEFRKLPSSRASAWFVRNRKTLEWQQHPADVVMGMVGAAHEELGESVSWEPIHVRIDSSACVNVQLIDLPSFSQFEKDPSLRSMSSEVAELAMSFMRDKRNVMLCIEEGNDASTMTALAKCHEVDPSFERTILVRSKLEKYLRDLTPLTATKWMNGYGHLPQSLVCFALSLPSWQEYMPAPQNFTDMREQKHEEDLTQMRSNGLNAKQLNMIGFRNLAFYVENKQRQIFAECIGPVKKALKDLEFAEQQKSRDLETELADTDPEKIRSTTRACGVSFATALAHVMGGVLDLEPVMDLEQELQEFHNDYPACGSTNFSKLPSDDFHNLADYIDFLRNDIQIATFDVELNGGAQFRRLMSEVEIFLRFADISESTNKQDVIQARGMSMASMTWRDVVVKILSNEAHGPLLKRIQYVGERIKWFFESQKEAVLHFMGKLEGTPRANMFSPMYSKHAKLIKQNGMIKNLVYDTYNKACKRQLNLFVELFDNMLTSTFANPWVFLNGAKGDDSTHQIEDSEIAPSCDFDHTKEQIPKDIQARANVERTLSQWLHDIPTESNRIDMAVEKVQMLVLRTYSFIRSQVCDQVELFAESFFKFPMLRQLEEDMAHIELSDTDATSCQARHAGLRTEINKAQETRSKVAWCIERIQKCKGSPQLRREPAKRENVIVEQVSRKRSAPEANAFTAPTPQRARRSM